MAEESERRDIKPLFGWVTDRLCSLVVTVLGYRSKDPVSIPCTTRFSEK
jgi:hypothetical protein